MGRDSGTNRRPQGASGCARHVGHLLTYLHERASRSGEVATKMIEDIVAEPEIGKIYEGKVVKLMDFGAFVNFMGAKDGLVHISQLKNERVGKVSDVVNEGDIVKVKVLDIDGRGKIKLSMKNAEIQ